MQVDNLSDKVKFNSYLFFSVLLLCILSAKLHADETVAAIDEKTQTQQTMETLTSILEVHVDLQREIREQARQLKRAASEAEQEKRNEMLNKLELQLSKAWDNFEKTAAGVDISALKTGQSSPFVLQDELLSLLEPLVKEMKSMTAGVREKSKLKEDIAYHRELLPKVQIASGNITALSAKAKTPKLKKRLKKLDEKWRHRFSRMQSSLNAAQLQLDKMQQDEIAFAESSSSYFKKFFQKRGRDVLTAFLLACLILLLSRIFYRLLVRVIPGYRKAHRSFAIRLLDLSYRGFTLFLVILVPMAVFYLVEDWVLFSLGLLILFSLVWTVYHIAPLLWQQIHLLLNIGSVREGERLYYEGLPWLVSRINLNSILENPVAGISLRLPIKHLIGQTSRPLTQDEPWFPCRKDDWVLLSDGVRGKVVGISLELIMLVERGGAHKTYLLQDFLGLAPRNLSVNFRIKESFGISYALQEQSTSTILTTLETFINERLLADGYESSLLNLRIEFQNAADSFLELVVIADFSGEAAPLYNRIRRAIQRYCVDACSQNNWEIPFPQLALHTQGP